jgi:hypothetical protein
VSQDNSCRYCYGVQRSLLKILGYRYDMLNRLERDFHLAGLEDAQHIALDFVRKLSRANPRPDRRDYEALERAGFGRAAIAEIAFAVAAGAWQVANKRPQKNHGRDDFSLAACVPSHGVHQIEHRYVVGHGAFSSSSLSWLPSL